MRNKSRFEVMATLVLAAGMSVGQPAGPEEAFQRPPDESKPLTWWHWIDGNVTKPGITRDLEAMKRAGLGGCYLFSITGSFPKGPATFGTPQWFDLLSHTVNEAGRLGLIFGVHNCDGWSESGGPWITPETSMKELTHTNLDIEGPQRFEATLPMPASRQDFYRDIAVVAFPIPSGGRLNLAGTTVTGTSDSAVLERLSDGKLEPRAAFPVSPTGHRFELALPEARTIRSLVFHNVKGSNSEEDIPVQLESSLDGTSWRSAGQCTLAWDTGEGVKPITVAFDDLEARFLRLSLTNSLSVEIGEIELSDAVKLHFAEAKAGWLRCRGHGGETRNLAQYPGPDRHRELALERVIAGSKIINLRSKTGKDGRLTWDVPPGRWRIMRVGYTTNGRSNKPATPEGRGLECDKLDPKIVRFHLDQYVGRLAKLFGPNTGKVFAAVETDSWECDVQNWTAGLEKRFKAKLGFDLVTWMPLLLEGWVIDNADVSERVLWDWRRFLADQFAENYFAVVSDYLRDRGLTYVCEGSGRQMYLYDAVGYQRDGDIPMGEFWLNTGVGQGVRVDNKVASSVAHTTGKRLVASESYTASARFARWQNHPYTLKPLGDRAFCAGVNQFVFHTFAHQPYEVTGPGFTMSKWGLNCNRANTWWEPGKAWMEYLARCNYLLREGRFAADVLYFIGEEVPNRIGWRNELTPALPEGYDFDGCDAKTLLEAKVKDGRIILPSRMEYRVLLLPNKKTMRPAVLKKVVALVRSGAVVIGSRPDQSPSMADYKDADQLVRKLAAEVWGSCDGHSVKERSYGRGRVFWGLSFPEVFQRLDLAPDFDFESDSTDPEVIYIHRRIGDADVYFVSNQKQRFERITARFRVKDRRPEIWDPVTGAMKLSGAFRATSEGMELPLTLDPSGSIFVVFRNNLPRQFVSEFVSSSPTAGPDVEFAPNGELKVRSWNTGLTKVVMNNGVEQRLPAELPAPLEISGPWQISFPPGLGAPEAATFDKLISWTERPETGIRYFSGTATYRKDFDMPPAGIGKDEELWLDLGEVQVIAEVRVNGQDLGILWKPPFRLNATSALKPGTNHIEIRVTNLWPNRMIGDEQFPDSTVWQKKVADPMPLRWPDWIINGEQRSDGRITFCTRQVYKKNDPLLDSGLIGPVRVMTAKIHFTGGL